MGALSSLFGTFGDLLLVILGFGFIVFIHEAGHFVAARWAGIRVLAFAIGFGPAMLSYRRGMGLRRGSTEPAYRQLLERDGVAVHDEPPADISPTEYRLNWLPFGGYVKMLGQEDLNPRATSAAVDSYQRCHPAKRLVVISAGVVANVVLAALVFMLVFMVGLRTEPPRVGDVIPGSAASQATPVGMPDAVPGLRTGDEVLRVNDRTARTFNDLMLAAAMASPGDTVDVLVERRGQVEPLLFQILPEKSPRTGLLELGILPAQSTTVFGDGGDYAGFRESMDDRGLTGVEPEMRAGWIRVGDGPQRSAEDAADIADAFRDSEGRPVAIGFASEDTEVVVDLEPRVVLDESIVRLGGEGEQVQTHVLGLAPVMTVGFAEENGAAWNQGLRPGDVFVRLGSAEYPSIAEGITEIRAHAGREIQITVVRTGEGGQSEEIALVARVNRKGLIGFAPNELLGEPLLALPPAAIREQRTGSEYGAPPAAAAIDRPGLRVRSIAGVPVDDFAGIRAALRTATRDALAAGEGAAVELEVGVPIVGQGIQDTRTLRLSAGDVRRLHELGWSAPPGVLSIFQPAEFTLKADGPVDAVVVGLAETKRVMLMTYVTFARLFQGSVRVEHLKGPVGIAHLGTRVADRGLIWLLFFMALISVNLAVVNFLPLPIVDGGQFLFIVAEWIRGRPVPEAIQSAATLAGLVLIGMGFLVVTFNDIRNVFTGL
ncbi:MAG: site-2 protease family protein [Planctomycetota bacterium]